MAAAAVFLIVFGAISLWGQMIQSQWSHRYPVFSPGSSVADYQVTRDPDVTIYTFIKPPVVSGTGMLLFLTSIGLGLILGIRQFWMLGFTKMWGFELHRSVDRTTILWAKFTAAAISLFVSAGLVWTGFYWYASQPKLFAVPPPSRVFIEGWIFVMIGLVIYFGTALTGLSRARWYTTKKVPLAFAVFIFVTALSQWKLSFAVLSVIIGIAILVVQIIDTFLNREY